MIEQFTDKPKIKMFLLSDKSIAYSVDFLELRFDCVDYRHAKALVKQLDKVTCVESFDSTKDNNNE